jgi:hypothetical protein
MTPHRCALIVQKDIAEESGDEDRVVAAACRLEMYERPPEEWEFHRPFFGLSAFLRHAGPGEFFQVPFAYDTYYLDESRVHFGNGVTYGEPPPFS